MVNLIYSLKTIEDLNSVAYDLHQSMRVVSQVLVRNVFVLFLEGFLASAIIFPKTFSRVLIAKTNRRCKLGLKCLIPVLFFNSLQMGTILFISSMNAEDILWKVITVWRYTPLIMIMTRFNLVSSMNSKVLDVSTRSSSARGSSGITRNQQITLRLGGRNRSVGSLFGLDRF